MDNITNINLGTCPLQYLSVGYVGETGARTVSFDFSAWATEYGAGVLQLLLQRPGDADPYPVLLDIDGTTAVWTPDATATEKTGQGQAQLVYTVSGVIVKNAIFRVLIAPSLGAAGDPPEPYEDWLEQLTELAAETQQNALDAAESAEAAGTSAGAAAGSAGAAAQSALDAEAAKTGAEAAEQTAQQAAALARAKAAQAAEAAQIAGREADYAQQQNIAAGYSAESAHDDAERAAQSAEDAQAAASAAQTAATAAAASASTAAGSAADAAAAVTEVETKGAEQIAAINQAGTTQIAAVDVAGAAQVQAIEDKGEEVIASIPSDYTELADDVSDLKSSTSQTVDTDAEEVDLDLIDANGNVLARFADGHIRTKNFDSANIDPSASGGNVDAKISSSTADLVLTDAQGNVIAAFADGHLQTKDFDSAEIVQDVSENQTVLHGVSGTDYIKQFTYDPSSSSKQTITGDFKAGDTILCHVSNAADDVTDILNTRWGTYAYIDSGGIEQTLGQERPYNFARYVLPADTTQIVASIPAELLESGTYTCKFIVYKLSDYKRQPHIVTVGSDGKRQFTSVRAAMDSFHDNNAYNTYEIWVYPGTYNVLSDFSDDEIRAEGFKGLWVKNGVTIRGIGHREQIILHGELDPDDYSSTIRNQISTLNMSGCCGLDNLTVTNQYLRYAVHDDHMSGFYQEQTRIVENCRFQSWNASSGGIGQAAYGAGGHNNKKLIIRNCDLGDRLIIHNTQLMFVSMTAMVENSTAQQVTLTDNNNPGFTAKTRIEFNNCNFDYIMHDRTSDGTEPTMILCGSGTHGAKLDCEAGTLYNFGDGMSFPATIAAGQAVKMSGIRTVEAATAADVIYGISIGNDGSHTIVQRQGYIAAQVLGLSGLSAGDYITLDANGACVAGGTAANAVGVVECIAANTLTAFIKLLI